MLESVQGNKLEYQRLTQEEQSKRGILGRLKGIIASFNAPTRNGRLYSEKLWDNVFEDPIMKEKISNRCVFGELGHPTDREEVDMEKIAICLAEQPKKDGKGNLLGVFDILDTPNGRILKTLCDYGCKIGVSSRGTGDVYDNGDGDFVDPDTYNCECWDAVLVPAVETARLEYVTESLSKKRYNKTLEESLKDSINKESDNHRKEIMNESLINLGITLKEDLNNFEIEEITPNEAKDIIDNREPLGKFLILEDGKWVAIDNSNGDAWTEEFDSKQEAINYLNGDDSILGIDESCKDSSEEVNEGIHDISDSEDDDELLENNTEKCLYKSVDNGDEKETVVNDKDEKGEDDDLIIEFKEALLNNRKLEKEVLQLQEELSVCNAKVEKNETELARYKKATAKLGESVKSEKLKLKESNTRLSRLNSISEENRKLKSENILTTNKFNKKINSLNESIKEKDSVIKDLTNKNSRLNEKLQTLKSSKSTELKALEEELNSKIKEYEKENNSLREQLTTYKSKLNTSAKLVEKYKGEVKSIKDNYVNAKAQAYGISANEVSKRLSESYEIKDVDSICDEVRDYKTRLKGLPCILNESSNIQVKNSKQNTLKGNSFDDDYVSPSLLGMADID